MKLTCIKCHLEKDPSEFAIKTAAKTGRQSRCKDCQNEHSRTVWYPKNRDKQILASRKWKKDNPLKMLATRYSIPIEEVKRIIDLSGNKCGICGSSDKLVFDHCHQTSKPRGILCDGCNLLLGRMGDSLENVEELLVRIRNYLSKGNPAENHREIGE